MPLVTRQANQGNLFNQDTEPPNWLDGDLWVDTSTTPNELKINDDGTAIAIGLLNQDSTIDFSGTTVDIEVFL